MTRGSSQYDLSMELRIPPEVYNRTMERLRAKIDEREFEGISDLERTGTLYLRVRDRALEEGFERGFAQGLEQAALERGQVRVLRRVLLDILELRGFTPTATAVARIESCDDLATLEAWYARARTCDPHTRIDDLLA
jgi:hypothetical protein